MRTRVVLVTQLRPALLTGWASVGFAVIAIAPGSQLFAKEPNDPRRDGVAFFESKIRPVLVDHCYECHSHQAEEVQSGLYLDSRAGVVRGGDSGSVIDVDQPRQSPLILALRHEDLEMPPDQKLDDSVIEDFERWIGMGMPDPRTEHAPPEREKPDWNQARQFWSYRKPLQLAAPVVNIRSKSNGPIDAFVMRRLEQVGLELNPEADRRTLIRRLCFDLIGLPPSPDEVRAFVEDTSPAAYERLVDRLLSSPGYGERWGRHWLDVAGYAESNGIIGDAIIPHAWHYRDYVIGAWNKDKPYDQFLIEQFAGDEIVDWRNSEEMTESMQEALTATGFLRCTPDGTDNQEIYQLPKRWDHIHASVEVAMKASMGLVFNCCRCHDHKFDPVPQEDYYKMVGLFLPAYDPDNWLPCGDFLKLKWPLRYVLRAGRSERSTIEKQLTELGKQIKGLQKQRTDRTSRFHERYLINEAASGELSLIASQLSALRSQHDTRSVEESRIAADLRSQYPVSADELERRFPEFARESTATRVRIAALQEEIEQVEVGKIWALWDVSAQPPETHLLRRGDFDSPGRTVVPGVPQVLDDPDHPFVLPEPGPASTGYRLAFANWLVRKDHPLTARVMVNRLWQHHFGRGIVATPDDFGSQGARPSHPQLLDWLATNLVDRDWSIKNLHRQIVTSAVYRQSSDLDSRKMELDPDNQLWSRRVPRRIEAETVRDAMLAAGDQIDRVMFGRPIPLAELDDGQYAVTANDPGKRRRSIYIQARRTTPVGFLQTFDGPEIDTNVPRRTNSNVPSQSLALMNNPFVLEAARDFADRLWADEPSNQTARIVRAFEIAFARPPHEQERKVSQSFFSEDSGREVWALFCQGLIASNEFLYVN